MSMFVNTIELSIKFHTVKIPGNTRIKPHHLSHDLQGSRITQHVPKLAGAFTSKLKSTLVNLSPVS